MKTTKLTLKSLQNEINMLKEELQQNKTDLNNVKDQLENVKKELKDNVKESENPKPSPESEFNCKICDLSFISKKNLKMHNRSNHTLLIKCEGCDKTFD